MEVKLLICGAVLIAVMATGGNAQLDVCGIAPKNNRIVGGGPAAPGAWPWQVAIEVNGIYACGGTLINNQWILTAAQCVSMFPQNRLRIVLGRDALELPSPNQQTRSLSRRIIHPQFNLATLNNDIALLQLSSRVNFNDYIRPLCLAKSGSEFYEKTSLWAIGWGNTSTNVPLPSPMRLQEVSVTVVSNSECDRVYGFITSNHMCTGTSSGGKGTCVGDGGSPLMKKVGNKWVQAGVMSFLSTLGCAQPNIPEGYIRVSNYESWISTQILIDPPGFVYSGATHLVSLSVPLLLAISTLLFSVFNL